MSRQGRNGSRTRGRGDFGRTPIHGGRNEASRPMPRPHETTRPGGGGGGGSHRRGSGNRQSGGTAENTIGEHDVNTSRRRSQLPSQGERPARRARNPGRTQGHEVRFTQARSHSAPAQARQPGKQPGRSRFPGPPGEAGHKAPRTGGGGWPRFHTSPGITIGENPNVVRPRAGSRTAVHIGQGASPPNSAPKRGTRSTRHKRHTPGRQGPFIRHPPHRNLLRGNAGARRPRQKGSSAASKIVSPGYSEPLTQSGPRSIDLHSSTWQLSVAGQADGGQGGHPSTTIG